MKSFDIEAEDFLRSVASGITAQFLSGRFEGSWHPNGFAVFHAGEAEGLGRLRLHVWARGQRVTLDGQPAIHSHPWDLCSLVLAGCYEDTIYRAEEFSAAVPGLLQGYRIRFGAAREGDTAYPLPIWYRLTASEQRSVTTGHCHRLAAGVLHATHVPHSSFAATLVLTSRAVDLEKLLLIGDVAFGAKTYVRPAVSAGDLASMQLDLRTAANLVAASAPQKEDGR
jgi:hypothetical protein